MSAMVVMIAEPSGAGATVKESLTVQTEPRRMRTAGDSSVVRTAGGNEVQGFRGGGIGRAFSPRECGSLAILGRSPRLVWLWAFGPQEPTKRRSISTRVSFFRAKGASPYQPRPTAWVANAKHH